MLGSDLVQPLRVFRMGKGTGQGQGQAWVTHPPISAKFKHRGEGFVEPAFRYEMRVRVTDFFQFFSFLY